MLKVSGTERGWWPDKLADHLGDFVVGARTKPEPPMIQKPRGVRVCAEAPPLPV